MNETNLIIQNRLREATAYKICKVLEGHQLCQCPLEYKRSGTAVFSQLFIHIPWRDKRKRLLPFLQADLLGYTRQPRRTGVVIFLVKGDSS